METTWPVGVSSTAMDFCQEPGLSSGDVATHTRVALTMLNSSGVAAQPPRSLPPTLLARVVKTMWMRPFELTVIDDGPPESAHCRSAYAVSPGRVVGTGGSKVSPPSVDLATHMLWLAKPDPRLWYSR